MFFEKVKTIILNYFQKNLDTLVIKKDKQLHYW